MKKTFYLLLALCVFAFAALGCGGSEKADKDGVVLKIGASPVPHAEILELVKPDLEKQGIKLEIIEFTDYVKPNMALNDKEIDANYFQHTPYLEEFCADRGLKLVALGNVHIEPMGIYSKKIKDLAALPENAKAAIPNDPTNGGRSLMLLEKAGIIKLKEGKTIDATVNDIVDNPKNIKIIEVEAALLPRSLDDTDIAVINSNFAMEANLNPVKDALFSEKDSPYANIIAVRAGDEKKDVFVKLLNALQTEKVKKHIEETYKGAVVTAF